MHIAASSPTYCFQVTLRPMDGFVAASIPSDPANGWKSPMFATSPNQLMIPSPLLGARVVHLRADWLYGEGDYFWWPQPYSRDFPHHTYIPLHAKVGSK